MKKIFFYLLSLSFVLLFKLNAQDKNPIYTGAPFLRIAPDARSGGLADAGVATTPDVFSQYWNPAKYVFNPNYSGVALSYTPWLNNLAKDMFLLNAVYFTYLGEQQRSTIAASLYYFKVGKIPLITQEGGFLNERGEANPNEFSLDISYGLRLSDYYSMAVGLRYIRSDLFNRVSSVTRSDVKAANTVAVDIAGYYQSDLHNSLWNKQGRIRAGFNLSNIGPKLQYTSTKDKNSNGDFLPTNLRLGGNYELILDDINSVSLGLEMNKLLVPTPKKDKDGNLYVPNDGVIASLFKSWGGAPDGFSETLKEITWSINGEYTYNQAFKFRAGYFFENPKKGDRRFISLGVGATYNDFGLDVSYLVPTTGKGNSPLENALRFGLTWNFGGTVNNY